MSVCVCVRVTVGKSRGFVRLCGVREAAAVHGSYLSQPLVWQSVCCCVFWGVGTFTLVSRTRPGSHCICCCTNITVETESELQRPEAERPGDSL